MHVHHTQIVLIGPCCAFCYILSSLWFTLFCFLSAGASRSPAVHIRVRSIELIALPFPLWPSLAHCHNIFLDCQCCRPQFLPCGFWLHCDASSVISLIANSELVSLDTRLQSLLAHFHMRHAGTRYACCFQMCK
jgi:hypothetical protein